MTRRCPSLSITVQGLRQHCPEGLHSATRIIGWSRVTSAPDLPEAALQFTLRKSVRKTVTPGKDSCFTADLRRPLSRYPRSRKSVVHAPGWRHPARLEAIVEEDRPAARPCQARRIAPPLKTHHSSRGIPAESRLAHTCAAGCFTLAQMSYYVRSFRASWTDRSKTAEAK
jgi:hypothetical protein